MKKKKKKKLKGLWAKRVNEFTQEYERLEIVQKLYHRNKQRKLRHGQWDLGKYPVERLYCDVSTLGGKKSMINAF